MLRVYIPARGTAVSRLVFNQASSKYAVLEYDSVVGSDVKAATRINALAGLVHTLNQFKEKGLTGVNVIYTVGLVSDQIQRGTFKYWIAEKKTSSGEPLHETELELWEAFAEVYQDLFLNVVIKNLSSATIRRGSQFAISNEQRIDDKYAQLAWDKLPAVGEAEEIEGDVF